jgi:hypothetical protein
MVEGGMVEMERRGFGDGAQMRWMAREAGKPQRWILTLRQESGEVQMEWMVGEDWIAMWRELSRKAQG